MDKRPNILLFILDALRPDVLLPGHPCQAPNIRRVMERGLRFDRAYTPNPTCSPARASLMTGLLPHNHGVWQVEHCAPADQCNLRADRPHWAQRLTEAGYRTGYFGKWHIERTFELERFGWQVNGSRMSDAFKNAIASSPCNPMDHLDPEKTFRLRAAEGYRDFLMYGVSDVSLEDWRNERSPAVPVDLASGFLADALEGDDPWCCAVSFWGPNEDLLCSRETFDLYDPASLPLPENFEDSLDDRPALYRREQRIFRGIAPDQWRTLMACYYARVTEFDRQLGRLLAQLERAGALENTLIVITSDHGRMLGAHGIDGHNFGAFEEMYRIPLIISGPGIAPGITSAHAGLQDLCPTLLDLAGAEPIDVPDSRSLLPVLRSPQEAASSFTSSYAESEGTRFLHTQRVIWKGDWKFVFNPFAEDELYNLAVDPHETLNLAAKPEHAKRVQALQADIWARAQATGEHGLIDAHYFTMQFAAVGPIGPDSGKDQ